MNTIPKKLFQLHWMKLNMSGEKRTVRLSKCSVGPEEREAVLRVLDNQYFGMGKEVQALELEIKAALKTDLEVICVNTGTAALHLAVLCLDLKAGDEVLVPSITYVASFQAISATGAKPVACDNLTDTVFIDLKDAEKRITKNTKAIMPVHYASSGAGIEEVYAFAKKHNLRVIEDAAQAMGCNREGFPVGHHGDILCFSMDGIKNITSGEGGVIVTGDKVLAQRIRDARLLGVEKDTERRFSGERSWHFDVNHQGFRYHMSDIMAAIGRAQLTKLPKFSKRRQDIVKQYLKQLSSVNQIEFLKLDYENIVPHIFVIKVKDGKRNDLFDYMIKEGVAVGFHYNPNHRLSLYKTSYELPGADLLSEQIVTLPLHFDLTDDEVFYVTEKIKSFFRN